MKRRTFLKALGLGSALIPIITKAEIKKPFIGKDVELFVGGEKITPMENSVQWKTTLDSRVSPHHFNCRCDVKPFVNNWSSKTPDEILSDLDEVFNKIGAATNIPVNRLKGI